MSPITTAGGEASTRLTAVLGPAAMTRADPSTGGTAHQPGNIAKKWEREDAADDALAVATGATQPVRHRLHERLHQHDIDHGGLVDNQQVTVERVVVATVEAAALRFKSPSNFPAERADSHCR